MINGKLSDLSEIRSIRKYVSIDGKSRGMRVFEVSDGALSFSLLPDKCLDIGSLTYKGTNIGFISKNGVSASADFDESFGGMLYTCGLKNVGKIDGFPMHGEIHNLPAYITCTKADDDGILVEGTVKSAKLFGQNLTLKRSVSTQNGALTVKDVISNDGYTDAEYALLYHINFGYPFLGSGTVVSGNFTETLPRDEYAAQFINDCGNITEPKDNREQVFFRRCPNGQVSVVSSAVGVNLKYDADKLPYLIEWKSMVKGDYALGLEPSTTFLDELYTPLKLQSGEKVEYGFSLYFSED